MTFILTRLHTMETNMCEKKYKPQDFAPEPSVRLLFLVTKIDNFSWEKNSYRNEGRNDFYIDQGVLLRTEYV